ncbi:adenine-specific DNA methylase [Candidatus Bathyarchaeota archaeon]|nr:adenine-specific DNA methylase [Candidatus Bathyarchaeota archaeon]
MKIERVWAMPSVWTVECEPIRKLALKYVKDGKNWVDPFAGKSTMCEFRNDIEQKQPSNMDALEYLKTLPDGKFDGVIFDPPYSVEQCLRRYTPRHNGTAGREEYWGKCKDEIMRIVKPGGYCLSFCWSSSGLGKVRKFMILEILLVCHGGCHRDTICTVEQKDSTSSLVDSVSFGCVGYERKPQMVFSINTKSNAVNSA